ncbi:hypothetical protein CsSME_00026487 [Camellia sinensis var. sinensis]
MPPSVMPMMDDLVIEDDENDEDMEMFMSSMKAIGIAHNAHVGTMVIWYSGLQSRVGIVNLLSDGFCWNLLRCIHGDQSGFISPKMLKSFEVEKVGPSLVGNGLRVLAFNPQKIMRGRTEYYHIDDSGHVSWLSVDNPNETGACSKGGPIDDLTRQLDGSPSPKEVVAQTETGHTDSEGNNMQVDKVDDKDATMHEHFSKLSC